MLWAWVLSLTFVLIAFLALYLCFYLLYLCLCTEAEDNNESTSDVGRKSRTLINQQLQTNPKTQLEKRMYLKPNTYQSAIQPTSHASRIPEDEYYYSTLRYHSDSNIIDPSKLGFNLYPPNAPPLELFPSASDNTSNSEYDNLPVASVFPWQPGFIGLYVLEPAPPFRSPDCQDNLLTSKHACECPPTTTDSVKESCHQSSTSGVDCYESTTSYSAEDKTYNNDRSDYDGRCSYGNEDNCTTTTTDYSHTYTSTSDYSGQHDKSCQVDYTDYSYSGDY